MKVVSFDKRFTTLYNYTGRILTVVDRSSERQINHPLNPLTPVPPATARDEPWHFFHL